MLPGTLYQLAVPVVWSLIATGTAVLYLATIFGLFFFWLYVVAKIVMAVARPIVLIMNRAYDN